jgi:hypothetical protein
LLLTISFRFQKAELVDVVHGALKTDKEDFAVVGKVEELGLGGTGVVVGWSMGASSWASIPPSVVVVAAGAMECWGIFIAGMLVKPRS